MRKALGDKAADDFVRWLYERDAKRARDQDMRELRARLARIETRLEAIARGGPGSEEIGTLKRS